MYVEWAFPNIRFGDLIRVGLCLMCENREPTNDVDALRSELAALLRLSHEKLEEMKQIQTRIDEMTGEVERLTEEMENQG